MNPEILEKFLDRIVALDAEQGGCWIWQGHKANGYAQLYITPKPQKAYRLAYEHFVAPIPEGLSIDHLCRNTLCVNPDHLEAVTPQENVLRGLSPAAINSRKTHCIRGHELTGENLYSYVRSDGRKRRMCAACSSTAGARRRARRSA